MRKNYPVEQYLRPPVEVYASLTYLLAASLCALLPGIWLMPGVFSSYLAAFFIFKALMRFKDANFLLRYQYQLNQLPPYVIDSKSLPKSKTQLFLGLGFEWTPTHTQRRADLERPEWKSITMRARRASYRVARAVERVLRRTILLSALASGLSFRHHLNPFAPVDTVEGDPTLHGVGLPEGEHPVSLPQSERVAHTFVTGTTRCGKTRLAEVKITQDIHNNEVVIVFDPKGDPDLLARIYHEAKAANRLHQLTVFHLGFPELSARYNPVADFSRITEVASRISSQLPGEGNSAAFREFTWRYVNVIAKAANALGKQVSYEALLQHGSDIEPLLEAYLKHLFSSENIRDWRRRLDEIVSSEVKMDRNAQGRSREAWACVQLFKRERISDIVGFSLVKTFEYDKSFYDRLVASLFPLLEKLTSGDVGALLSPDYFDLNDDRVIFNWMSVLQGGGIVYVGLDALTDAEVASAVGASMFADLTSCAGQIYKFGVNQNLPVQAPTLSRKICVHADEFSELVGEEFVPLLNKAGGAGFQVTAYTQTLSDIIVRFGDQHKAGQVVGNLGTVTMLRVKELATAQLLTDQLRDVEVRHLELQSLVTDSSNPESSVDFTSRTGLTTQRQRVPLIHPNDLLNLPKGHAFSMIGGTLHKLRLPLFDKEPDLPDSIRLMTDPMRVKYRAANDDWSNIPDRWVA